MCEAKLARRPLGEIADTNPETLPQNTSATVRFRYIDLSAVEQGFINWDAVEETNFAAAPSRARRVVKPLDVLFGTVRPNLQSHGRIGVGEYGSLVASTGFSVIRSRHGVSHPAYLFHSIMSSQVAAQAVRSAVGSSYPAVNESDVRRLQIFLPGFLEQERIADVIDTLDTAIHETEAIVAKLKAVKQGLLHDLLTRGIGVDGELRPPQAEAPHLYKESPLGSIPKDWDFATLEAVSTTVTSGSRDWARFYADSGALFVRIGNLTREHINFRLDSTIYVRPPRNADGQRTRLESGDILISITADLGIVGVVADGMGEAYINQHIALVRPSFSAINPRYVGHYLASPVAQVYISKLNDAGAKAGLNLPAVRGLLTARPVRAEQDLIAERLDGIDHRIQNAVTESAKLRELKAGLMDDLLTGRVRVAPLLARTCKMETERSV